MRPRLYHATSILLPDCRVGGSLAAGACAPGVLPLLPTSFTHAAGGDAPNNRPADLSCFPTSPLTPHALNALLQLAEQVFVGGGDVSNDRTAELYSPPYLFKGPRPVISSVQDTIKVDGQMGVVALGEHNQQPAPSR